MRRSRIPISIAVAVLLLVGAEGTVRAAAPRLPHPLVWNDHETQNKVARMEALAERVGPVPIVFVGSSSMNAAADPKLTTRLIDGQTAFNASLNGADLRSMEFWITRVVAPRLHPRVVVLGTTSLEWNDNGITQADFFRRLTDSKGGRRASGKTGKIGRLEAWAEAHSSMIRYRTLLRRPATLIKGDPEAYRGRVGAFGVLGAITTFQSRPYAIGEEFRRRTVEESYHSYAIGGQQEQALERLTTALHNRGIALVLVKMPITKDLVPMHPHGAADYERYEREIEEFADRQDVPLVDATTVISKKRFFVDPIHVNDAGKRRFTTLVAPAISRVLDAATPRDDGRP